MIVKCPHCGFEEEAPEEYVGETAICDSCQGEYVVGGVAVPSSAFEEDGDATVECPYCHAQNSIKREYANRNVRCCECDGKYHIQIQEQSQNTTQQQSRQETHNSQQEDEFVRFEDLNLLDRMRSGHILKANGESQLAFALKLPLGICKPIVVMCNNCKRFDVSLVNAGEWQRPLCCECGKTFLVREGRKVFLSEVDKVNKFKTREEEIALLHRKFATEERIFEGDWAAFVDPKSNLRIERIKGNIDRLYKRLQISESKRLIASHDKQTGAIIAFTNNWDSTLATVGGLISLMTNADKEQSIGNEAASLSEQLDQNENILNYYYDLVEEFTGVDKQGAKRSRMKTRTGYSNANELPCLWSAQDAAKCTDIVRRLKNYVMTTIRYSMRRPVIYMGIIASLMFVSMMATIAVFSIDVGVLVALMFVVVGAIAILLWLVAWLCSDYIDKLIDVALHASNPESLSGW